MDTTPAMYKSLTLKLELTPQDHNPGTPHAPADPKHSMDENILLTSNYNS
jgi:hypothetical protein